ncbi:MAG: SagB/ThcOx family dehydrogenase, partial [Planctomycetes bacterium]|nr:SagB/ThcOx family dehydrogenase [Planctomycetota bacterium]
FLVMLITGLIQVRFELHRFIYHIYGVYLLVFLSVVHLFANWKKIIRFIKRKSSVRKEEVKGLRHADIQNILSLIFIFSLALTLGLGYLQVRLNFPRSRFIYHIYSAYLTLTLGLIHICLNLSKVNAYFKSKSPAILLSPERRTWKPFLKGVAISVTGLFLITSVTIGLRWWSIFDKQMEIEFPLEETSYPRLDIAMKYHEKTKHTYAELMARTGGLDWSRQPSVFKEYPQAELIELSTDFDFDGISVEEAIKRGSYIESFSEEPITETELSRLLYYTNGITGELRYPGLTYYLRAAPSAGALYPTVIYLVVNNVEGLKKGIYHYSVKDHGLHLLKEGDFSERLSVYVNKPLPVKKASAVFILSTIFYRTKWKYGEQSYRYVLLDAGHVAGNLDLISGALGLESYPIGTFVDDKINQLLDIDGRKEAVVYISAVGRKSVSEEGKNFARIPVFEEKKIEKFTEGWEPSEIVHEMGKINNFNKTEIRDYSERKVSHKSYPEANKILLSKEFSRQGLSLDDTIRKRRSARDYSGKPLYKLELSRLLYYTYGVIKDEPAKRAIWSIEGLYPIELYVVVNNVEGIARGIYHYNPAEHALELLKEGDYRFRIANACLGQELVGNANIAIIKTAIFERVKRYGDRGYRYVHLDAGVIGENIYLEAVSMGLGVCGIGAFFDDQINDMLNVDGAKEALIYVTSVGRV